MKEAQRSLGTKSRVDNITVPNENYYDVSQQLTYCQSLNQKLVKILIVRETIKDIML